ncbi:MAG: ADP compounds hydrolase NudE [Pseudomonadota bacterium]
MSHKPTILQTQTLARTRLFHIEQLDLRFSNGVETRFERLLGSPQGAVLIVPMLDEDTVLMIREYAAGIDRYELTLPKGRIEEGEALLSAANREITEEVGYGAHSLHHLTSLSLAPGYVGHFTHVVLARDLYPKKTAGDEPEPLEVVPWRLSELPQLLLREDCTEARSIAALFMTREYLADG